MARIGERWTSIGFLRKAHVHWTRLLRLTDAELLDVAQLILMEIVVFQLVFTCYNRTVYVA